MIRIVYDLVTYPFYLISFGMGMLLRPIVVGFLDGMIMTEALRMRSEMMRQEKVIEEFLEKERKKVDTPDS